MAACDVTNAFRLRVWLGPALAIRQAFATEGVTNAFRLRVWLGRNARRIAPQPRLRHQCLSAESLVRTGVRRDTKDYR